MCCLHAGGAGGYEKTGFAPCMCKSCCRASGRKSVVYGIVPIDFKGEAHDDGEDDEKPDAAGQEGVGLHLEQDVDVGIEQCQQSADEASGPFDFEQACQVADEQGDGHDGGDEVCPAEAQVLGNGNQQGVEKAEGKSYQEVLEGMDVFLAGDFHKETDDKGQDDKEGGILDGTGCLLVLFYRQEEIHAEEGEEVVIVRFAEMSGASGV